VGGPFVEYSGAHWAIFFLAEYVNTFVVGLLGALLFLWILFRTVTAGARVGGNPWGEGATTLEWTVPSPAPFHTHEVLPEVGELQPAE